jgi:3-polyprenyl-4-hydroxybenzoate decarboxylase
MYYERGERMPVAVTLGGDPAYTIAATSPLPDGLDEILFAGFVRRKSVELVRCKTIDLEVPADVDFVLEGYVQPGEMRPEGPFGDHTGFYTALEDYPVFHLTTITHRRDAIYPTTIVGVPPMEDYYLGDASVRTFLPVFKMNFPEIVDMTLPPEGVFHNLVFVSIRKQYPYQAFKIMHGLWGMGQMMFSKYIVVVDEDCDVHNTSEVLFRLCANTDPKRDSTIITNPSDSLDHAPNTQNVGSHMGLDATRKLPSEDTPAVGRDGPDGRQSTVKIVRWPPGWGPLIETATVSISAVWGNMSNGWTAIILNLFAAVQIPRGWQDCRRHRLTGWWVDHSLVTRYPASPKGQKDGIRRIIHGEGFNRLATSPRCTFRSSRDSRGFDHRLVPVDPDDGLQSWARRAEKTETTRRHQHSPTLTATNSRSGPAMKSLVCLNVRDTPSPRRVLCFHS